MAHWQRNRTASFLGGSQLRVILAVYVCWPTACLAALLLLPQLALPVIQLPPWFVLCIAVLPFIANACGHTPFLLITLIAYLLQRMDLGDACTGVFTLLAAAAATMLHIGAASLAMPVVACAIILAVTATACAASTQPRGLLHVVGGRLRHCPLKMCVAAINVLVATSVFFDSCGFIALMTTFSTECRMGAPCESVHGGCRNQRHPVHNR